MSAAVVDVELQLADARHQIATLEIHMREREAAHTATKHRADELAAQVALLADALRDVLECGCVDGGHRSAAGLLTAITATTRTTR